MGLLERIGLRADPLKMVFPPQFVKVKQKHVTFSAEYILGHKKKIEAWKKSISFANIGKPNIVSIFKIIVSTSYVSL